MIASLVLLSAQIAPAAAAPSADDEIVVVGRRFDAIRVFVGRDADGKWTCGMAGSSGVPLLDRQLCKAVTGCVRKGAADQTAVDACVSGTKRRLFARWQAEAEKRR